MITVRDLHKTYRSQTGEPVRAVGGVSFEIAAGEVFGLIGPSGCGKTSIARLIAGLIKPDQGTVAITGGIGFVSQDPYSSLCPVMRVSDIVSEPLKWRGQTCEDGALRRCFAQVGLDFDQLKDRLPYELSGGMRQRAAIARALMCIAKSPGLLVLDEPVTMLDYDRKLELMEHLCDLAADSAHAVLLISHDIGFVRHMATRIAVMQAGVFIEEGRPWDICQNPQHDLTKELVTAALDLKSVLDGF